MLGKPTQSKVKTETQQRKRYCRKSYVSSPAGLSMLCNVLGTPKEPGILPRVLDATFHYIGSHVYEGMDLKPYHRNDAQHLDPDQVKQERSAKAAIFASVKEVRGR